jgi:hypothetical protein
MLWQKAGISEVYIRIKKRKILIELPCALTLGKETWFEENERENEWWQI